MRVHAFRMWFGSRLSQGIGAARRAGMAISKKVRASLGKIEGATGIGDEEMGLTQGGSRAWWDAIGEAAQKVRDFLEKSSFVRIGKLEAWVRKKLGLPPRQEPRALPVAVPAPKRDLTRARGSVPLDPEQAARLRAQVQLLRTQANTSRGNAPAAPKTGLAAAVPLPSPAPPPPASTQEKELRRSADDTQAAVPVLAGARTEAAVRTVDEETTADD